MNTLFNALVSCLCKLQVQIETTCSLSVIHSVTSPSRSVKENPLGIQYAVELVFALLPNLTLSTSRVVKVLMSVAYERTRNWFHSGRFP